MFFFFFFNPAYVYLDNQDIVSNVGLSITWSKRNWRRRKEMIGTEL